MSRCLRKRFAPLAAAALAASGCAFSGIDLVQDTRVSIRSPRDGQTVTLPLTVSWSAKGITEGKVSYAVFVDQTTIKSGETLRAVVPESDRNCLRDAACPDTAYLARHGVYVTESTSAVISRVSRSDKKRAAHRIAVVILVDGRRDGEGAFSRTVYVESDES